MPLQRVAWQSAMAIKLRSGRTSHSITECFSSARGPDAIVRTGMQRQARNIAFHHTSEPSDLPPHIGAIKQPPRLLISVSVGRAEPSRAGSAPRPRSPGRMKGATMSASSRKALTNGHIPEEVIRTTSKAIKKEAPHQSQRGCYPTFTVLHYLHRSHCCEGLGCSYLSMQCHYTRPTLCIIRLHMSRRVTAS
ncbi:hypothetical protein BDV95DRAFT_321715 [Massariosphaeria phaeospora]|uniref:Uncharacterized protein n=1 Tax=Massariosphaeria phaeospora TaxID=100035 RepID=A0A7C8IH47_9PLEO|nr:hypothetical protein BDV95DRAFT_321715 [Massariosphaeria phaeospora]